MPKKHKPFAGIPAWFSTSSGHLITNGQGRPATERDIDKFFRDAEPDLDRLVIEMCEFERARGNRLTKPELEHYKAAKLRMIAAQKELSYQVV